LEITNTLRYAAIVILVALFLPLGQTAGADSIGGKIANPERCKGVQALLRVGEGIKYPSLPKVFPGSYDKTTGEFTISSLPDGRYDLRILVDGGMFEGVDLSPGVGGTATKPFLPEHEKAILEVIANLPDTFADIQRPFIFRGSEAEAKVLVEKIRHRAFHSGKEGETIWRIEVWTFENRTGAWVKTLNRPVISRLRIPKDMTPEKFRSLTWLFSPDIAGIEVSAEHPVEGLAITVPKPDISKGKVAGSVSEQIDKYKKQKASSE